MCIRDSSCADEWNGWSDEACDGNNRIQYCLWCSNCLLYTSFGRLLRLHMQTVQRHPRYSSIRWRIITARWVRDCRCLRLCSIMMWKAVCVCFLRRIMSWAGVENQSIDYADCRKDVYKRQTLTSYPLQTLWPILAICLTMLALNFIGDGLGDALDPKKKKK